MEIQEGVRYFLPHTQPTLSIGEADRLGKGLGVKPTSNIVEAATNREKVCGCTSGVYHLPSPYTIKSKTLRAAAVTGSGMGA